MYIENMEKITIKSDNKYMQPALMIIVYSGESFFIEVADIDKDLNIISSKPMTKDTLLKFNQFVMKNIENNGLFKFDKELLPKNVIFNDGTNIIWYEKASKRSLFLHNDKEVSFHLPTIVFQFKNDQFYIFITKDSKFNNDTRLYPGAFPNSYEKGNICIGNNKKPAFTKLSELTKYYTDLFFESKFTAEFPQHSKKHFAVATTEKFPDEYFKNNKYILLEDIL